MRRAFLIFTDICQQAVYHVYSLLTNFFSGTRPCSHRLVHKMHSVLLCAVQLSNLSL